MREVFGADGRRLLAFHSWHKHPVIIHQCKRTVRAHHDIVGFDVAMSERLRAKPSRHFAETVAEHRHSVSVRIVSGNIRLHRLALNPVHQQYGELFVLTVAVNEKLLLQIFDGSDVRRVNKLQFLGYLAVSFRTTFLFLGETLQGIAFACLLVLHLEHDSKRTAATIRLTVFVQHGHQMAQLVKIVLSLANGGEIFRYKRVLHRFLIVLSYLNYKVMEI